MSSRDRRRFIRKKYKVEVTLDSEDNYWVGLTENISEGGLFVTTKHSHEVGDIVVIKLTPPGGGKPIRLQGVVRWTHASDVGDKDSPPGFGMEMLKVPEDVLKRIQEFIHGDRPAIFYDDIPQMEAALAQPEPDGSLTHEPAISQEALADFDHATVAAHTKLASLPKPRASFNQHFLPLKKLTKVLGVPERAVARGFETVRCAVEMARVRDEIAEPLMAGLSEYYDSIALLTLSGSRSFIWGCFPDGITPREHADRIVEIVEGGILQRLSWDEAFFWGPLPDRSVLRSILGITHNESVLVVPITFRSRAIAVLCLDLGNLPYRSPGKHLELLLHAVSHALQKVIHLRHRRKH